MKAPFYIKTENSLLSSLIKIDDLIKYAIDNNIKALTITDDNMFGALEFFIKCKKNNIKPIIGLEIFDIVLYAMNYKGYQNLIKLNTIKSKENITLEHLKKYSDDVICIIPYKNIDKYDDLKFYKYLYKGYSNLKEKQQLGKESLYFNEVLYLDKTDKEYLKYLLAIKDNVLASDIILENDNELLAYQLYDDVNNEKVVSLCNLEIPFKQDLLPIYECETDSYSYLKKLVIEGLKEKFGEKVNKVYHQRLKYELDIINKMGFCNYFLIVSDYVNYAKKNNILVGPGRGSAAGSLVSYCLGITSIDPIKYDLLFERFLNPNRITMPDIDIDFPYDKRDDILKYCIDKYGSKKVAPIITFGTLGSRQVIRDVARSLSIDNDLVNSLSKLIDSRISLIENYKTNEKLKKLLENSSLKKLYKIALKLEGLKRHTSIHAAGVVMSKYDLDSVMPLIYHDNFYITGYSMEYLEELGLLKMDLLALKNLTLIDNILKEVNLSFDDIPLDDEKSIGIFNKPDTIGIFQFESKGMIDFLKKFKPNSFEDIVAAIALYRPGPMDNIDTYIKRKHNEEKIDYITDDLVDILKPTYGIIIYQEQIMQIAQIFASYTLAEADILRKAMSKKKEDVLLKEKDKFINNSIKNGHTKEKAIEVYNLVLKFASYGFNKAHSVSYAMIAYKLAYLKTHYYNIFVKNLLSMVIGSDIKTKEYIDSCRNVIPISKPDINISELDYTIKDNKIIYPLTNIKNVGSTVANYIVEERKKGLFKDIFDFFQRCYGKSVNIKVIENLNKASCFSNFCTQRTIDENIELLTNYGELGSLLGDSLKPQIKNLQEYDDQELLEREFTSLGFYLTNHPVTLYKDSNTIDLDKITNYFNKNINCVIYIDKIKKINTKNNDKMYFITGSDETATSEFILFPKDDYEYKSGNICYINGKVEKRFDKYQVVIKNIRRIENEK